MGQRDERRDDKGPDADPQSGLQSSVAGYRQARELADSARFVEDDALHRALDEARRAGLGVRDTAKLLDVPRSSVSRWLGRQSATGPGPSLAEHPWVSEAEVVLANNHAWRHEPDEQIAEAPFRIETTEDGRRTAFLRPAPSRASGRSTPPARSCRFGRHQWQEQTNPETGASFEICARCDAYRDDGSAAAPNAGVAGAVQANIGGFGMAASACDSQHRPDRLGADRPGLIHRAGQ